MEDFPAIPLHVTQDLTDFQLVCELEWGIFVDCDRGFTDKEELRHYDVALEIERRMEAGTWGQQKTGLGSGLVSNEGKDA